MRKYIIAVAIGAGLGVGALASAANSDNMAPQAKAYLNFGFGGKDTSLPRNFHYGLRLDQDDRVVSRMGRTSMPSIMQLDFNAKDGFQSAYVNGVPFARRFTRFDEDGGESSYSMVDWGLLAIGVAGLGFGIAEVVKTHDSRDPTSTGGTTGTTGSTGSGVAGTGITGTTGVAGTGITGTTGVAGTGITGTTGVAGTGITGTTGVAGTGITGTTGIAGTGITGTTGVAGTGITGTTGIAGTGLAATLRSRDSYINEERNVEYQRWLDGGTGQMGDIGG